MKLRFAVSIILLQLALVQISAQKSWTCKNPRSRICLLQHVDSFGDHNPHPNLHGKHTLIIRSGNVPHLTKKITSQFGEVTKVTLDRLNIETLHIPSHWTYLSAESNRIVDLIVESMDNDSSDRPLGDEPVNSSIGTEEPPTFPEYIDSNNLLNVSTTSEDGQNKTETVKIVPNNTNINETGAYIPEEVTTVLVGHQLQSLNLANNKLKSIDKLKLLVNLKELFLQGNELEFIPMETFVHLKKLRKLSLENNKISHISYPSSMELPSLEWFSLVSNKLKTLHVSNWKMPQLLQLDISHNMLVKLDVNRFDQFISLEKLALSNNSWTCYWLFEALRDIRERNFITLVDQDDEENCPKELPVDGICCSSTKNDEEPGNENLLERKQRFRKLLEGDSKDFKGKIDSYKQAWSERWESLNQILTQKQQTIQAKERELKDDSTVTEQDIDELTGLIEKCKDLLKNMENLRKENDLIGQNYSQLYYKTIGLQNKLLSMMRQTQTLTREMNNYEISFKAQMH